MVSMTQWLLTIPRGLSITRSPLALFGVMGKGTGVIREGRLTTVLGKHFAVWSHSCFSLLCLVSGTWCIIFILNYSPSWTRFLSLSTIDMLGLVIPCWGFVLCTIRCLLDASSMPPPPLQAVSTKKCLQTLPNIPEWQNLPVLRNAALKTYHLRFSILWLYSLYIQQTLNYLTFIPLFTLSL